MPATGNSSHCSFSPVTFGLLLAQGMDEPYLLGRGLGVGERSLPNAIGSLMDAWCYPPRKQEGTAWSWKEEFVLRLRCIWSARHSEPVCGPGPSDAERPAFRHVGFKTQSKLLDFGPLCKQGLQLKEDGHPLKLHPHVCTLVEVMRERKAVHGKEQAAFLCA